jgi:hypothetical protein
MLKINMATREAIMKKLWRVMILGGALALQWPAQAQSPPAPRHQLQLPAASANNAVEDAGGSVQFIGTATVLIRFRGMTILTDPNFLHKGEHVHLGYGLKSERHAARHGPLAVAPLLPPVMGA